MKWKVPDDFTVLHLRNGHTYEPADGIIEIPDSLAEDCALANQTPDLIPVSVEAEPVPASEPRPTVPAVETTETERLGGSAEISEA